MNFMDKNVKANHEEINNTLLSYQKSLNNVLAYKFFKTRLTATKREINEALIICMKEYLIKKLLDAQDCILKNDISLINNIGTDYYFPNLQYLYEKNSPQKYFTQFLEKLDLKDLNLEYDYDLCFGDRNLGTMAVNYMESLTSRGIPAISYGIKYNSGNYKQRIVQGNVINEPINTDCCTPFEIPRSDLKVKVYFGGKFRKKDAQFRWFPEEEVIVVPSDFLIPGYKNQLVNVIRLWSIWQVTQPIHYENKNVLDYIKNACRIVEFRDLTKTAIPILNNQVEDEFIIDYTMKQNYLLAAATLADILRNFNLSNNDFDLTQFCKKVYLHISSDSCTIIILELFRILIDEYGYSFSESLNATRDVCRYTIHTHSKKNIQLWPVDSFKKYFPRHWHFVQKFDSYYSILCSQELNYESSQQVGLISQNKIDMCLIGILACQKTFSLSYSHFDKLTDTIYPLIYSLNNMYLNKCQYGVSYHLNVIWPNRHLYDQIKAFLKKTKSTPPFNADSIEVYNIFLEDIKLKNQATTVLKYIKMLNKIDCLNYLKKKYFCISTVDEHWIFYFSYQPIILGNCHLLLILLILFKYYCTIEHNETLNPPHFFLIMGMSIPGDDFGSELILFIEHVCEIINNSQPMQKILKVLFINFNCLDTLFHIMPATDIYLNFTHPNFTIFNNDIISFLMNGSLFIATPNSLIKDLIPLVKSNHYFFISRNTFINWDNFHHLNYLNVLKEMEEPTYLYSLIDSKYIPFITYQFQNKLLNFLEYYHLITYAHYSILEIYKDEDVWYNNVLKCMQIGADFLLDATIDNQVPSCLQPQPSLNCHEEFIQELDDSFRTIKL